MSGPSIRVTRDFYAIRVFINDQLHVFVKVAELLSMQSWRDSPTTFSIEYTLKGGTMLTEYDDMAKWQLVTAGLEGALQQP